LRAVSDNSMTTAAAAAATHTVIQSVASACRAAISDATSAIPPIATMPIPETAVNEPARSIACLM
jgi:hypothetical protein